jgi:hypothetical protein
MIHLKRSSRNVRKIILRDFWADILPDLVFDDRDCRRCGRPRVALIFAVSAGASGAIFGLYGALVAVLLRCRQAVQASTWARLSKGMAAYMAFSLLYELFRPEVAVVAHLAGLSLDFF